MTDINKRIEEEAEKLSKTEWASSDKDRRFIKGAFIAGAKWRNNAVIDDAMEKFGYSYHKAKPHTAYIEASVVFETLESLKLKP